MGFYELLNNTRELGDHEVKISTSMGLGSLVFWCQLGPSSNTDFASRLFCVLCSKKNDFVSLSSRFLINKMETILIIIMAYYKLVII